MKKIGFFPLVLVLITVLTTGLFSQRQMENLDRGVVRLSTGEGNFVSWRLFGTDPDSIAFNLYRGSTKVNSSPITNSTNFFDRGAGGGSSYTVRPIINNVELAASKPSLNIGGTYLSIPLRTPSGYTAGDASAGDLDGDGQYEIIVKWEQNPKDNAHNGTTGQNKLDAYKLDGTFMWRIDLGRNIREGAHYLQFMVYDLDGDGKAEIACKTADGTRDGQGNVIGDAYADYRNSEGRILDGPEFLTVFDGETGRALDTTGYLPARGNVRDWGDNYGNRVDRFLAGVGYFDGVKPSLLMCRGYYTRSVLAAWDFRDGKLTHRWTFDSNSSGNGSYAGQGDHSLSIGDVDFDGKDEVIYGSCAIDDNGRGLYNTRLGHGDALHLSDMDPDRPGLEVWNVHESGPRPEGAEFRDARTGSLIFGNPSGGSKPDVGRGLALDIDPRYKGFELWSAGGGTGGLYTVDGQRISGSTPSVNMGAWWDGDLLREILDGTKIDKWDYLNSRSNRLLSAHSYGCASNNGSKANPCLSADILGDWREEVIWRTEDSSELRLFTTSILTDHRIYTLMHDPVYRLGIAWQNVAYNQPPHTGFYLGDGMNTPPRPDIYLVGGHVTPPPPPPPSDPPYQAESAAFGGQALFEYNNAGFTGQGYINFPADGGYLEFQNAKGKGENTVLRFRYALGADSARTGRISINGSGRDITFEPTGSWTTWEIKEYTVYLDDSENNTIRLESNGEDLANIDVLDYEFGSEPVQDIEISWRGDTWPSGFSGNVTISNNSGQVINGWTVELTFKNGEKVTGTWNAESGTSGSSFTFTNISWNGTIHPGTSQSFGFQGTHNGTFEFPADAKIVTH